tara:strand:+ start:35 stop:1165 length:1131 start_codon:yes stop_codon:yes gene_type:complete
MARKPATTAPTTATTDATASTDVKMTPEEQAIADATALAAKEAREEQLAEFGGKLSDQIETLQAADQSSALEAREMWVGVGDLLLEGEALFISEGSNGVNDKAYGQWLKSEGLTALGARPTRSAAKWLAETHRNNPELWALFPTESKNGQALRRSPQTLYSWVRENAYNAFNAAIDRLDDSGADDGEIFPAKELKDKAAKQEAAKKSMPNIFEVAKLRVGETAAHAEAELKAMHAVLDPKAKSKPSVQAKAQAAAEGASDMADAAELELSILSTLPSEKLSDLFIGWTPKVAALAFSDRAVRDAAQFVFDGFIKKHPKPVELIDAIADLVEAMLNKVDADGGDVEEEEDVVSTDEDYTVDDGADDDFDFDGIDEDA